MQYFYYATILAFALIYLADCAPVNNDNNDDRAENVLLGGKNDNDDWETYKRLTNKAFDDKNEERRRRDNYRLNMAAIRGHNQKSGASFSMEVNELADLSQAEIAATRLGAKIPLGEQLLLGDAPFVEATLSAVSAGLPASLDWRNRSAVTPVKNQGSCGSCWAFSATGALESRFRIKSGNLMSFSEQNLMDCTWSYGNFGCNGGWMNSAFAYVKNVSGINLGSAYPYTAADSRTCRFNRTARFANITGFTNVQRNNETALMVALQSGPVAVAINAGLRSFQFYKSGVYNDAACSTAINHAVLLVGYGTDAATGKNFWIVKNSWGVGWGDKGYIRMARGSNLCGILSYASFPNIA